MASKRTNKQATGASKTNSPNRKPEHQPRRRIARGRSKSAAPQTSSVAGQAVVAPEGALERIDLSTNTAAPLEHHTSQSNRPSEGVDLATANVPGAGQPRASTKRAVLIGMLERPEGASVVEIGQRLGWLPHTVRAAITGLRHAGREVTRSKDVGGRSVYRLALVETASDR
jgi:hypothetical protein